MAAQETQVAILKAAVIEFAQSGLTGARIEKIAVRAGFNKALVYRYFKSKSHLFREVLEFKFRQKSLLAERMPDDLGDMLVFWYEHIAEDGNFVWLVQREALEVQGSDLAAEDSRKGHYERLAEDIERRKARGQIDAAFATRPLLLALSALVSFPAFFPNLARLISGRGHDAKEFRAEWAAFLRGLASHLAPR